MRSMMALTLAVGSACAATEGNLPAPTSPGELTGRRIVSVEVIGNERVSDADITRGLVNRSPQTRWLALSKTFYQYDPVALDDDVERVEAYYARRGFFEAEVVDVRAQRADDGVRIQFFVREGPASSVTSVDLSGLPPALEPDPELQAIVTPLRGAGPFVHADYLDAKRRLRQRLRALGHAFAEVQGTVAVDRDAARVRISFAVDPGPRVRFGDVTVQGLDRIPKDAVRARLAWEPGEIVSPQAIDKTKGRLYQLGYFRSVEIELENETRPPVADVMIRVAEGSRKELRLGGGVAYDDAAYEVRARVGYNVRSFLRPLITLRLDARPAYRVVRGEVGRRGIAGEARVALDWSDAIAPRVRFTPELRYQDTIVEAYTLRGGIGHLGA